MNKDNKDALVSSALVSVAYGGIGCGLALACDFEFGAVVSVAGASAVIGLIIGLLTTWDVEE